MLTVRAISSALRRVQPLHQLGTVPIVELDAIVDLGCLIRGTLEAVSTATPVAQYFMRGRITDPWSSSWSALTLLLLASPQPRGGLRWLIGCPACGRRCRALYLTPGSVWMCRGCSDLRYLTQRLGKADRLEQQADRIRRLAGWTYGEDRLRSFPDSKPRGWWSQRFERLRQAHDAAIETVDAEKLRRLIRWMERHPSW